MKVIHLALSENGGAGIAARGSIQALNKIGITAEFWTAEGGRFSRAIRSHKWTIARILMDSVPLRFYPRRKIFSAWSNNWQASRLAVRVNREKPDIVHLHWIGGGFLSLQELALLNAPVVWTLHDAWAVTGGCHYPEKCLGYVSGCGSCPQLASGSQHDLSWRNFHRKRTFIGGVAAFIAPSVWLARLVKDSDGGMAKRLHIIPNGFDGSVFFPRDLQESRRTLELPLDDLVFVAGAQDLREPRKGFHLLREAMVKIVAAVQRRCVLVAFGEHGQDSFDDWPCEVRWVGTLKEGEETARVYCAADVLLMTSLQDNLPNMPIEAMACGCPTIAFNVGGLDEIVEPGKTGLLAAKENSADLGLATIAWLKNNPDRSDVVPRCRVRFEQHFSDGLHSERLKAVYELILMKHPPARKET